MTTKRIVYERPDGGVSVVTPAPGARLCSAVTVDGERIEVSPPAPFDAVASSFGAGALVPEWAETEDEFVQRIRDKDVPADATKVEIMNAADLPPRESRKYWRLA